MTNTLDSILNQPDIKRCFVKQAHPVDDFEANKHWADRGNLSLSGFRNCLSQVEEKEEYVKNQVDDIVEIP